MSNRAPAYVRYRSNYARVKIDGRWVHLGRYDSKEALAKYKRLVTQWASNQPADVDSDDPVSVAEVLEAYRRWALVHYGDKPRGRYRNMLQVLKAVRETYADIPAKDFSPKRLKVVRQAFIDRGNCRRQVNDSTRDVVAVFRWAAEEELVSGTLVESLKQVRPLELGRCNVREGKPVESVPTEVVDKTLPFLSEVVADMVRLQLVSGARPGEICSLTPSQIDRSGDVWLYKPEQHNEVRGVLRTVRLLILYGLRGWDKRPARPFTCLARTLQRAPGVGTV